MLKPFFVWQDRKLIKVKPEEVLFLCIDRNYTRIFLLDKREYMVRSSLSSALKKLPRDIFIKIHRSYIASVYHIDSIEKDNLVAAGVCIPIGKQYRKSLIERLNIIE